MADGTRDDGPSLEMPSFSLRRRKRPQEEAAPEPEASVPEPNPTPIVPEPEPEPVVPEPEPTPVVPEPEPTPVVPDPVPDPAPTPIVPEPEPAPVVPEPEPEPLPEEAEGGRRRARTAPPLTGLPAALVTGVLVGALAVGLAWLAGAGCDVVRGTTACGGALGLPILLAGLAVLAWAGTLLLRFFGITDAGSTSILAVGVLTVLVMLFLLDVLDEWSMLVVVPVLAVLAYGLSWWVTASVVGDDAGTEVPEPHDVR
ncbi:hypothetical protein J2X46_003632 [Nocardioides sp. BE266]|uniref:hypothetical protein n=1 Tax=Nocardioides sp. BE266 TaxID=2817725 RepID=UPI00285835ED|nr:hypothetical protein [Nocardioides sp. BE266]MDR7254634.1 hypothetical protein [Nocardioides sp. BE266]